MKTTQRPLHKEFLRYLIPSVAAQWVFSMYTMVDGMFVARGVSEVALAAVNISLPFVNFIFALSLIMAVGSSTIISICFGKKELEMANRTYTQNLLLVVMVSLVITILTLLFREQIALFLGANEETLGYVKQYISTVACFAVFFMLGYYFEILIKADGKPRLATMMITAGALINCVLDYIFVFVIPWGVFGAAFATGISQLLVTIFFAIYFFSSRATLRLRPLHISPALSWRTIKLGLPSGITELSSGLMIFLFNHAILRYIGTDALVSYTIVAYVNTIIVMSMTGVAQGMQPLVSYYYGRGETRQHERLLRYALISMAVLTLTIGIPSWLGAGGIVSLFISAGNPLLRAYSTGVFRIFAISFLFVGCNVVLSGYFTAVDKDRYAIISALARGFVFIALSLGIMVTLFGGEGIWWAPTLSEILCLGLTGVLVLVYRRHHHPADKPEPPQEFD